MIRDVACIAGSFVIRLPDGHAPIRFAGMPVRAFAPGWSPQFVYDGFFPIRLMELRHEDGQKSTWYLDAELNRIAGEVHELSNEIQWLLGNRYRDLARSVETCQDLRQLHAATLAALGDLAAAVAPEQGRSPADDTYGPEPDVALSPDLSASIGLSRLRNGDPCGRPSLA